jgi:hypothetical protein
MPSDAAPNGANRRLHCPGYKDFAPAELLIRSLGRAFRSQAFLNSLQDYNQSPESVFSFLDLTDPETL